MVWRAHHDAPVSLSDTDPPEGASHTNARWAYRHAYEAIRIHEHCLVGFCGTVTVAWISINSGRAGQMRAYEVRAANRSARTSRALKAVATQARSTETKPPPKRARIGIRAWLRDNGHPITNFGRIPKHLEQLWDEAHPPP